MKVLNRSITLDVIKICLRRKSLFAPFNEAYTLNKDLHRLFKHHSVRYYSNKLNKK